MQENHRKDDCFPREANQGNGREYHFLGVRRVQETDGLDPLSGPVTYLPTVRYVSQCQRSHQPERGFKPQKPALCGGFLVTQV